MVSLHQFLRVSFLYLFLAACTAISSEVTPTPPLTPTSSMPWIEESVTFPSVSDESHGAFILPNEPGPFPAIVLISGSANEYSGLRSGINDLYMKDQAQNMVKNGFAVLRYDPPGVGLSTGDSRFETLDDRVQESMAALHYLQTRTDIQPDRVGLWGVSQGGWVIEMAAADNPMET